MDFAPQDSSWERVVYFRVFKEFVQETQPATIKLYGNGFQQCPVRIEIAVVTADGDPADLPDLDLDRIQLIDYSTGEPLNAVLNSWWASRDREDYLEWDESMIPPVESEDRSIKGSSETAVTASALLPQRTRSLTFYVNSPRDANESLRIAARIPLPDGGYTTTRSSTVHDPDGMGEGGLFNSSVLVRATPFPSLDVSHYGVFASDGYLVADEVGNQDDVFKAVEHYLHVSLYGRNIDLLSVGLENGMFASRTGGTVKAAVLYYSQPNSPDVFDFPPRPSRSFVLSDSGEIVSVMDMYERSAGTIYGKSQTRVVLGLIKSNAEGTFSDGTHTLPSQEKARIRIHDIYGKTHELEISFESDLSKLRLAKEFPSRSWAQVGLFRVYKDTITEIQPATLPLFNNGLQRCPVKVSILVLDENGNPVPLPDADLERLELIDFDTGEPLPFETTPSAGWGVAREKGDYEWDETVIPISVNQTGSDRAPDYPPNTATALAQPGAIAEQRNFTLYVSSTLAEAKTIAARIPIPGSNAHVTTNSRGSFDDLDGTGDGNGQFKSSVTIRSVAFPTLPVANYGVFDNTGNLMAHRVGNSDHFYWAAEFYLHVELNGRTLPLREYSNFGSYVYKTAPQETVKWALTYNTHLTDPTPADFPPDPAWYFTLDNFGSGSFSPYTMFSDCVGEVVGTSRTRVVIGLLMGNIAATLKRAIPGSQDEQVPQRHAASYRMLDAYGNLHLLRLSFGDELNTLRLAVW